MRSQPGQPQGALAPTEGTDVCNHATGLSREVKGGPGLRGSDWRHMETAAGPETAVAAGNTSAAGSPGTRSDITTKALWIETTIVRRS